MFEIAAIMNDQRPSKQEGLFSFSGIRSTAASFVKESIVQIERILPFKSFSEKEPVDAYLKSPEEMEAEFSFLITRRNESEVMSIYTRTTNNSDLYVNTAHADQPSGFMEENY